MTGITTCPTMKSTAKRMGTDDRQTHFCETTAHYPSIGPGTYKEKELPKSTAWRIGAGDRWHRLGRPPEPETRSNVNISPGMYDKDAYHDYHRGWKWDQTKRSATREQISASRNPSKYPVLRSVKIETELCATRPDLDYTLFRDNIAWSKGIYVSCASRFTPRDKRPKSASPEHYLRGRVGSPSGSVGVKIDERGRMSPTAKPIRKDPKDIRSPPRQRAKTAWGQRTPMRTGPTVQEMQKRAAEEAIAAAKAHAAEQTRLTFYGTDDGAEATIEVRAREPESPPSPGPGGGWTRPPPPPPSDGFDADHTCISYKIDIVGNLCKSPFNSAVSRSPRTNPINGVPITQDPACPVGPGYYEV